MNALQRVYMAAFRAAGTFIDLIVLPHFDSIPEPPFRIEEITEIIPV